MNGVAVNDWFLNVVRVDADKAWFTANHEIPNWPGQELIIYDRQAGTFEREAITSDTMAVKFRDQPLWMNGSSIQCTDGVLAIGYPVDPSTLNFENNFPVQSYFWLHRMGLDLNHHYTKIVRSENRSLRPLQVLELSDGDYLVLGRYGSTSQLGNFVMRFDPSGEVVSDNFLTDGIDYQKMAVGQDGYLYLSGSIYAGQGVDHTEYKWVLRRLSMP